MEITLRSDLNRFISFILMASVILAIGFYLMSESFNNQQDILAIGVSVDIALLIPLTYFFMIRNSGIPKLTLVPVFVLSLVLAYQIVPIEHQNTLSYIEYLLIPVELTVIGLLIYHVIKIGRDLDQSKNSLSSFPEILKNILEKRGFRGIQSSLISSEASLFYYTFAGWGSPAPLAKNEFSYDKGYQTIFIFILFLLPVETVAFHYLIGIWSQTLAWVLTAISAYSVFFILGDRNSMRHRPITVTNDSILLPIGLRWKTEISFDQIKNIEIREADSSKEDFANLTSFGSGNILIILKEKLTIRGIYGIKKHTDRLSLSIDEHERFLQMLN